MSPVNGNGGNGGSNGPGRQGPPKFVDDLLKLIENFTGGIGAAVMAFVDQLLDIVPGRGQGPGNGSNGSMSGPRVY